MGLILDSSLLIADEREGFIRSGQMIGPHYLIVAATALQRRWAVATFNAREFRHVRELEVVEP